VLIIIQGAQQRGDKHLRWRSAQKATEIQALIEGAHWLDGMSIFGTIGSLCGPKVLIEGAHWLDRMSIFGTIGSLCGPKVLIEAQAQLPQLEF
jgi:hypothetical protein